MILSICIPTYNRGEKLIESIQNTIQANSDEFEIIIVDNASPVDIEKSINFKDDRIRYIKREKNVGGPYNVGDCLRYGNGIFSMLCLDKDTIIGEDLDDFISVLKNNLSICGGYVVQNKEDKERRFDICSEYPILRFGYLNSHPSGQFFRSDILHDFINGLNESQIADPCVFHIYMAQCASKGSMMLYDSSLVRLESEEECKKIKTHSFKKEDNTLFFAPQNRIQQFIRYLEHVDTLKITDDYKKMVIEKLYLDTIIISTISYANIMRNKTVCEHYGLDTQDISLTEMRSTIKSLKEVFRKFNYNDELLNSAINKGDQLFKKKYFRYSVKKMFR